LISTWILGSAVIYHLTDDHHQLLHKQRKMVDSSKSTSAYETLIGLRDKITRLNGIITPEGVNKLEDKLGGVCTVIKMHHYMEGQKYGHLASVILQEKYRIVISNNAWIHAAPANPGAYSAAALGMGNTAAQRKQFVAKHKVLQSSYANYLGVEEAGKELILYAVGHNALAPLKKQYIGFGNTTILLMLDHLRQKTVIRMTTAQKYEYKNAGFNAPWDPTMSIAAYFTSLDRFQISLEDRSIATSNAKKTMAAGAQMWNSEMFTEDQMLSWENEPAIDQTWPNLQTHFTKKYLERKQYSAMMAKQSRFKEAALLARETAATEEEGETQAMLFAMLQEQHNKQMATMAASNKANMDAMMERMNMLVAAGSGRRSNNKENTPPTGNTTPTGGSAGGNETKKPKRKRKLCSNCKMFVSHAPNKCYKLEANEDTCYPRWTSVFVAK
jgi:hypothetical protein